MEPDAPLKASEKGCRFCPVKHTDAGCVAYDRWMRDLMVNAFDDLDDLDDEPVLADPDALTPARRYHIVRHAHLVRAWLADLHEQQPRRRDLRQARPRIEGGGRSEG